MDPWALTDSPLPSPGQAQLTPQGHTEIAHLLIARGNHGFSLIAVVIPRGHDELKKVTQRKIVFAGMVTPGEEEPGWGRGPGLGCDVRVLLQTPHLWAEHH